MPSFPQVISPSLNFHYLGEFHATPENSVNGGFASTNEYMKVAPYSFSSWSQSPTGAFWSQLEAYAGRSKRTLCFSNATCEPVTYAFFQIVTCPTATIGYHHPGLQFVSASMTGSIIVYQHVNPNKCPE